MKKSFSFDKVHTAELVSNARVTSVPSISCECNNISKKRHKYKVSNIFEQYSITIKPKLCRSSSLSDLTKKDKFTLDFVNIDKHKPKRKPFFSFYGCAGDGLKQDSKKIYKEPYMFWNHKEKRSKKKDMSNSYGSKLAEDYMNNFQREINHNASSLDNSSTCSTDPSIIDNGPAFPFKSTPSGNLKVQSNQVVFQSSTVGVLLADPTQAKVKVKFEGKAAGEPDDILSIKTLDSGTGPQLNFGRKVSTYQMKDRGSISKAIVVKDDQGKDLSSLGYTTAEPVDWMRVQLPKKPDLIQEFYRRVHNFVNTDTTIRIGDNVFHCHKIVLQIYSSFFNQNPQNEIDLPIAKVTPDAFQAIYEWMIFSGQDNHKILRKDNILDLFCAAQYLGIKDLEDQCWAFIADETIFTEDSAFNLFRQAKQRGMTTVMDLMVPRVMKFFLPLVASKDFLSLEPDEVMVFLKSNYISVTSEIEVLMAGVRWLYGDWNNRRRYVVDVMRCVRFGLISPWQLVDIKRNPDNAEILEIVNEPEVQQMVDDGLAYVIIKYWYGNNSKNYYHWIDVLGLTEPAERNWIGEEKNHVTYKDFLKYLEQFMVPKEQMYQQMAMMQTTRRSDDMPGVMRGIDSDKMDARRRKFDFPLPASLITGEKDQLPSVSEFFENRRMEGPSSSPPSQAPATDMDLQSDVERIKRSILLQKELEERNKQSDQRQASQTSDRRNIHQIHMYNIASEKHGILDPPEKDSDVNTVSTSSETVDTSPQNYYIKVNDKRQSMAASYLANATAALAGSRRTSPELSGVNQDNAVNIRSPTTSRPPAPPQHSDNNHTPRISLFNDSKESMAKRNMNKLSTSILGPSNKIYIAEGSLFNWDRETVLVFGGIDPHTPYGIGGNTGKYIYRFDPVGNVWDDVGELPEPRHHHSVAFLRGRVYLAGGADPRDDDIRGKSVVVSTVWSYEPVTRSWYSESGLAVPRKNFGLVVHKMHLYAIGGQDKKGRVLRSVERFNPKSASWTEVRSMNVARMAVACTKYREYIWVAGGMTGEKKKPVCKIVECYNSNTNEWTEIHSLRFPRCFATLFAMSDKLYIVGGAGKISDKERTASSVGAIDTWDWKSRAWRLETEMSMPRHGHALAYLGTQLIIIGGVTTIYMRALNNVESFCCERGAWIRGVATLPIPLSGHGAVTLPPASLM